MTYVLTEFSKLPVERRVLMLQYRYMPLDETVQVERDLIKSKFELISGVRLVDTFDVLAQQEASKVWKGHHSYFGNQLVCQALVSNAF